MLLIFWEIGFTLVFHFCDHSVATTVADQPVMNGLHIGMQNRRMRRLPVLMSQIAPIPSLTRLADPANSTPALGKVLVVEDDPSVQRALKRLFEAEGYAVEIHGNGQSALESFHAFPPAIIVLDLRLPRLSGHDLCKEVKAQSPTLPIVVLSAACNVSDKVLLLELGADDYVTKPFSPRELLARVRAALRHSSGTSNISLVRFESISIDLKKMEVLRDGEIVMLTAQEFKTLQF